MFRLDVFQTQWVFWALAAGTALVLTVALAYVAYWPPTKNDAAGDAADRQPRRGPMPLVLIATFVVMAVFAAVYLIRATVNPPNW